MFIKYNLLLEKILSKKGHLKETHTVFKILLPNRKSHLSIPGHLASAKAGASDSKTHADVSYTKSPGSEKNQPRPQSSMLWGWEASD